MLDKYLIANVIALSTGGLFDADAAVYYLKMKGDYYRYIAEVASDETKESVV